MKFPPLPRTVDGLLGPIPVRRTRDMVFESGEPVGGLWYPDRREIVVGVCRSRAMAWFHLLHEKAHADFDEYGVKFPSTELEERACDSVAISGIRAMRAALSHRRSPR